MPPSTFAPARPVMALALRLAFGLLTLTAIGWQLSIHLSHGYNVLNFFTFSTRPSSAATPAWLRTPQASRRPLWSWPVW